MSPADLKLHELHTLAEMEKMREPWNNIVLDTPTATPFQTWEWNFGIATFEARSAHLRVVVAEDKNGKVVGIAPFRIRSLGMLTRLSILEFIGSRESDYVDLLFLEPHREAFARSITEWIERNKEWRILSLGPLRQGTVDVISQFDTYQIRHSGICPFIQLPATFEEYVQNVMQKRLNQSVQSKSKLLTSNERLAFSISRTPSELERDLPVFFDLHQRRQNDKGERGRFSDNRWRECFKEMSLALLQAGALRLGLLTIDRHPAASFYNLRLQGREYFYLAGMDPGAARHSPGNLLHYWMIREAIKDGLLEYDFLAGKEAYKLRWTKTHHDTFELVQARSRAEAILWRKWEAWRNRIYRSRVVKRVYFATIGRFNKNIGGGNNAS